MEIEVIRSSRKTLSVEIKRDLHVLVRAPYFVSKREINRFVDEKRGWIESTLEKLRLAQKQAEKEPKLTDEEIRSLTKQAAKIIPERTEHFASDMGVTYGRVAIKHQVSRWGSCSSKGNLNFNCLLVLVPPDVLDYVVVHELCHLKELNHSARFWGEVERVLPDYREQRKWLKDNGSALIARLR